MANYLIRLQLPDRPGALGSVASRIGAVGGDVVSIDILQRDDGAVVDELGVGLADPGLVDLLRAEILEVDGVTVEALRAVDGTLPDHQAEMLEVATALFEQTTPTGVLEYLTSRVCHSLAATYAAALDPEAPWPYAVDGEAPPDEVLRAMARATADDGEPAGDVASARMARAGVVLVTGREGLVFRARERQRVSTMAELADHRWLELTARMAGD